MTVHVYVLAVESDVNLSGDAGPAFARVAPPFADTQVAVKLVIALPLLAPGVKETVAGPVDAVVEPETARTAVGGLGRRSATSAVSQLILGKVLVPRATGVPVSLSAVSMRPTVAVGMAWRSSATQPATAGLAMLVPDALTVPPPIASEITLTPGATRSVVALVSENDAITSVGLDAATDRTPERHAGAVI